MDNTLIIMIIYNYSQLAVSEATRFPPSALRSTASALPPGVLVMVVSFLASKLLSEVEALPLSKPRTTNARTRSSWPAAMVPRVRRSSDTS
jgi:hypothetical protein